MSKLEVIDAFDNSTLLSDFGLVDPDTNQNNVLNLKNNKFDYGEILDLIDAYSDIGPSIQDVVNDMEKKEAS